jgi:excisionase family DNA binding protein
MNHPYTPETLAEEWQCSAKHIRNLIHSGSLRAFRLGGRLYRILVDAVQEFEKCQATGDRETQGAIRTQHL